MVGSKSNTKPPSIDFPKFFLLTSLETFPYSCYWDRLVEFIHMSAFDIRKICTMGILIIAKGTEESPSLFSSDQLFEQVTCCLPVGPKCPNAIIAMKL